MKKRYLIPVILVLVIGIVLIFLSSIVRNYVNKNGEELVGRKVSISDLHFDYLNVAVTVSDLVVYEKNAVDSFLSVRELEVDFSPWKLFRKEYSFSKISVVDPLISVEQYHEGYNFTDLIPEADTTVAAESTSDELVRFSLYNISLTNGEIRLYDQPVENRIAVTNLNFDLPLIAWDNKQSNVGAEFSLGDQGLVQVKALVDNEAATYEIDINTKDIQINPLDNYMRDFVDVQSINALLTSDIKINGSMDDLMNIEVTGSGQLNDISVIDAQGETVLAISEARTRIKNINLKTFSFDFSSFEIDEPELLITRSKETTNMERLFAPYLASDTTQAVQVTVEKGDEVTTSYAIDTLIVNKGKLRFVDNTLNRKCQVDLTDLDVNLQNLSDNSTNIPIAFSSNINKSGYIKGTTKLNLTDMYDFLLEAKLTNLDLVSFSPYSEYYIASPFTQGWFNYDIMVKMGGGKLNNENDIHVGELEFGKKTSDKPYMKVPIRLGLYVMKDANDNIDINMPVTGSTDDPKFKLGKIIWGAFLNVLSKAALSPFKAMSGLVGTDPEKLEYLQLSYVQDSLEEKQIETLQSLSKIMHRKPELLVSFIQRTNEQLEKEKLAVKLAKTKFMAEGSEAEWPADDDQKFMRFLTNQLPGADTLGVEMACSKYIPVTDVDVAFGDLLNTRNTMIKNYFTEQGIPAENVHVSTADLENLPAEIRRPEFKVEVSLK